MTYICYYNLIISVDDPIMTLFIIQAKDGGSMLRTSHLKASQSLNNYFMSDFNITYANKNISYSNLCNPYCDINYILQLFVVN